MPTARCACVCAPDATRAVVLHDVVQASDEPRIEAKNATTLAKLERLKPLKYFMHTHKAVFVEVKVNPDLMAIHATRVVNEAAGRILNSKTASS